MIFREKLQFCLEIKACDPLNYTIDHSKFIASIQKEEFISSFNGRTRLCFNNRKYFYGLLNSNNNIIVKLMIKFIRSLLNMRETLI